MHYVGSSHLLGGCFTGHSLFHVEAECAIPGEGLQSMGQPSCCQFILFHLIWGSCFLLGDWFIITVKPRRCFRVFSLNSLFLSQLFVECMKLSSFLYFASSKKPLINFYMLSFLMFIPGGLVGIEENCEIFPGCLPAVSIKCQHSSQRTGKGNVCHAFRKV